MNHIQIAYRALKMANAAYKNLDEGQKTIVWVVTSIVMLLNLLLPIFLALLLLMAPFMVVGIVLDNVVKVPGLTSMGKALSWAGCKLGSKKACQVKEILDIAKKAGLDDVLKAEFDCSNHPPDYSNKWCDKHALDVAEEIGLDMPIPAEARWQIPIYIKAQAETGVPWELIAAVHATRTGFGLQENCAHVNNNGLLGKARFTRGGTMNFTNSEWTDFGYDAGKVGQYTVVDLAKYPKSTPPESEWGVVDYRDSGSKRCFTYTPELKVTIKTPKELKENREEKIDNGGTTKTDSRQLADPVDAIFTQARILKYYGADNNADQGWKRYSGSPALSCTGTRLISGQPAPKLGTAGDRDDDMPWMKIYPYGGGAGVVPVPQDIIQLAERYTFVKGWTVDNKDKLIAGESASGGARSAHIMPKEVRMKFYNAAGSALGMTPEQIKKVIPALEAQGMRESGYDPSNIQHVSLKDGNESTPMRARGWFQFVPGTFNSWAIPGYGNVYNPMHNLLAAMNAMHSSTSMAYDGDRSRLKIAGVPGYWPYGTSGWGPGGQNSYAGKEAPDSGSANIPYTGKDFQYSKDPLSKAVASRPGKGKYYDPCYTAAVHDWYSAITQVSLGVQLGEGFEYDGIKIPAIEKGEEGWHYLFRVGVAIGLKSDCGDDIAKVTKMGKGCVQTQGGGHSATSDHYVAQAVDWGSAKNGGIDGSQNDVLNKAASFFIKYQKPLCIKQVIWLWTGHYNHIHVAAYGEGQCPKPYKQLSAANAGILTFEPGPWSNVQPVDDLELGSAESGSYESGSGSETKIAAAAKRAKPVEDVAKAARTVKGKVSWYGGPRDKEDNDKPATGVPNTVPGIAIYNRTTLGGFWRVTLADNNKTLVLQQTDLGPAPGTGRKVDVNYTAVKSFGYTEKSFPTDTNVTAVYLGNKVPS